MSFKNLEDENARLTASGQIMARALGAAVSLLVTIINARDWADFCTIRDKISPQVVEMRQMLERVK